MKFAHALTGAAILMLAVLPPDLSAQTSQGRITGRVLDPGNSVVPGVEVTAINQDTGIIVRGTSNAAGIYVLPFLEPGTYTITASTHGFKKYERKDVNVTTAEILAVDVRLELGDVTETVVVTAEAPLLESADATVGQTLNSRVVSEMPLSGRRALELVKLAPGVIFVSYSGLAKPQFAVSGGRAYKSAYMLDGGNIQNLRTASLQVDIDPPVEVIREFKLVQNGYSAEYGSSGSGIVVSTTKSGTNAFHGSAFEFFRNDALDAANFFAPIENGKKLRPPLRYNLFGGTVGGPIIRNKTHFFVGYEGTRRSDGFSQILTVPTEQQLRGDFSQTFDQSGNLIQIFDPATTRVEGGKTVRDPFPGNIIPANRLDPVAQVLADYWPSPNRAAVNLAGAQNFAGNRSRKFNRDNVTARVDHAFSDYNRFFFRFVYNKDPYIWTSNYPGILGDPQSPMSPDRWQTNYLFADTHTLTANLIADTRYTFSHRVWRANSAGLGSDIVERSGLTGVPTGAFPAIRVSGVANLGTSSERLQKPIQQHQITNSWTWIKGSHAFKFGGEARKSINQDVNRPIISGQYNFSATGTGLPGNNRTGLALASYMLGYVNAFSLRETDLLARDNWYLAAFAQDDWKITRALTLNLGLRWEVDTPIIDRNDRMNGFDPYAVNPVSGTPGVVRFVGLDGWPDNQYPYDLNNFGPRFGFAWRPFNSENWVVRGGYGIFFEGPSISVNAASLGFERSAALSSPDNGITPALVLRNGVNVQLEGEELTPGFGAVKVGQRARQNVQFYPEDRRTGYAQHLSFGIQRQLPGNMVLEASYVGNLSRGLPIGNLNINQVPYELMGPGNAQSRRPYPQFNNVISLSPTIGFNNYHSGVLKMEKRYSHGLNVIGSYVWSRSIGNSSNTSGDLGDDQIYQDLYNRAADRGPDALDIVHRFSASAVYDLPIGKGRRWLTSGGVLSSIIGGWTVGAISNIQSGGTFTVTMQTNTTNAFSAGGLRANVLRDPNLPSSERTIERWFDTEAFAAPDPYTFGNAGRGILRADGRVNFDFSINKNFYFAESRYIQFRGELFNAFNHPDFAPPNDTMDSPGFGTITSATDARTVQLGLRIVF